MHGDAAASSGDSGGCGLAEPCRKALRLLGLNEDAVNVTRQLIESAFRIHALHAHPDKQRERGTFLELTDAKNILLARMC